MCRRLCQINAKNKKYCLGLLKMPLKKRRKSPTLVYAITTMLDYLENGNLKNFLDKYDLHKKKN